MKLKQLENLFANILSGNSSKEVAELKFVPTFNSGEFKKLLPNINILNPTTTAHKPDMLQAQFYIEHLANKETIKYLKEILGFPSEFSGLLNQISEMFQNKKLTIEQLKQFLDISSNNAIAKLIKEVKELAKNGYNSELLLEMIKVATNLVPTNDSTMAQMTKNIVLLYLPWLPLNENIDFQMYFGSSKNNNDEKIDDEVLTILIQTLHYGLIKILLMTNIDNTSKIDIKIICPKEFPKDIISKEFCTNKETNLFFETIKLQKINLKENKQKIDFLSGTKLNIKFLFHAYSLIKQIIEIDKMTETNIRRERMLD